ncbi:MAG: indolepyruvate ferredoxin oxidoreductase family protein [Candidatus Lambdaproteobacteria bacterium]|nr:indolepyruvate ferredoxin oxidoreductase family protein [Candidatus Lambdaproteobacteria bacterium]
MNAPAFDLDAKYTTREGRVAMTGVQALVRIPMDQHRRDRDAGIRLGTFISGYQGSPLGDLDRHFERARALLAEHHIVWQAGINEDVAAGAIYGAQLIEHFPHSRYDGLLGIWYGKAPGVDRAGDAIRHGNFVGTGTHGAALLLSGDDPACKSSTLPTDSAVALYDLYLPTLVPGDPQAVLELGLHAIALSRYSGLWAALKIVTNVADGGAIVEVHPGQGRFVLPELEIEGRPFRKRQDLRLLPPYSVEIERMIHYERMAAARAYVRANRLDRITVRGGRDRVGLVAYGKTYDDLLLALRMLGLGEAALREAGIRLYRLALTAPVEPEGLAEFSEGLEEIVVVEEKRGLTELLIRGALFNRPRHPAVFGKYDDRGLPLFPIQGELQPDQLARLLGAHLARRLAWPALAERLRPIEALAGREYPPIMARTPYFCSGCPHNISTRAPEGEQVGGGIGCHAMALNMGRGVVWLTQMGGEGSPWLGLAPFTDKPHLFQNVGDGTYYHSASKVFEACIAARVNITFRLLYNTVSAMTGSQVPVGFLSPLELARKLAAEGAKQVVIVAEDMARYAKRRYGPAIRVEPRAEYARVLDELARVRGVTVVVFDQQCAAEKRRMRRRGLQATPRRRVVINEAVCEGCGDCGVKSNCLSVVPVETEYGRKTRIHQATCNFDYSCLAGNCPAFMTVELGAGARPAPRPGLATPLRVLPPEPPARPSCAEPYGVVLVGIGGTGVVTVDALLVTAAQLEGKYALHLDQTGLAQKGGAVVSNFIVSESPLARPNRIAMGEADLVLAFDLLATVSADILNRCSPGRTAAMANTHAAATAQVVTDVRAEYPALAALKERLERWTHRERNRYVDVAELTGALFGDHAADNVFLLGAAYQAGLLPLRAESIERAITANGVQVAENLRAFRWGRAWQHDPESVERLIRGDRPAETPAQAALRRLERHAPRQVPAYRALAAALPAGERLEALLEPRLADLILYQDVACARRYLADVARVAAAERERASGRTGLAEAFARGLFKLMAYKDEYEVARLWLHHPTRAQVRAEHEGPLTLRYLLQPPLLKALGLRRKLAFGPWIVPLFRALAALKGLRGTPLDPFGGLPVRQEERRLIGWYRGLVLALLPTLGHGNHGLAVEVASLAEAIRGYDEVKARNIAWAREEAGRLLAAYGAPQDARQAG